MLESKFRIAITTIATLALLGFAACGDSDDPGGDGDTTTSTSGDGDGTTGTTGTTGDGDGDGDTTGTTGDGDGDGDTTTGDGDGDGDSPPPLVNGCDGATFYEGPTDLAEAGPWPVGAVATQVGRVSFDVWYPAELGSDAGKAPVQYDIRNVLPPTQRGNIPDEDNPFQECDCVRDLPLDTANGPYPVVVFVHGTASFRTQSLRHVTHWASRGFIVVAADHPGLLLGDTLSIFCPNDRPSGQRDLNGDVNTMLDALENPSGDLAFLSGKLDLSRIAVVGHSAGGSPAASLTSRPGVRVSMPWSAGPTVQDSSSLEDSLFITGTTDAIIDYSRVQGGYNNSPSPKRLVGIRNGGHLVVSDLCALRNSSGENILETATRYEVCGAIFGGGLFDCKPEYIDDKIGADITNISSLAVLQDVLQCQDIGDAFSELQSRFGSDVEITEDR